MQHRPGLSLLFLVCSACNPFTDPGSQPPLLTKLPRALSAAELRIVDGANSFSFELLRQATNQLPADSNAFLSPLSASMALGLIAYGVYELVNARYRRIRVEL